MYYVTGGKHLYRIEMAFCSGFALSSSCGPMDEVHRTDMTYPRRLIHIQYARPSWAPSSALSVRLFAGTAQLPTPLPPIARRMARATATASSGKVIGPACRAARVRLRGRKGSRHTVLDN